MRHLWTLSVLSVLLPLSLVAAPAEPRAEQAPAEPLEAFAGDYYLGDGLGVNRSLTITPDGTFSYAWRGCLGLYAQANGAVFLRGGRLVLETRKSDQEKKEMFQRLVPIRWGERLYLIPEEDLLDFVNGINRGWEPRDDAHGMFYLRQDDWEKPAADRPNLPEIYREYLLKEPVTAIVLRQRNDQEFELDAGRRQGLRPGMVLTPAGTEGDLFLCNLTIVSTDDETSVARGDANCEGLGSGQPVSTRPRFTEQENEPDS